MKGAETCPKWARPAAPRRMAPSAAPAQVVTLRGQREELIDGAHETAIHRFDAQLAAAKGDPVILDIWGASVRVRW